MKLTFKNTFTLLTGVAIFAASCTKTDVKKTTATTGVPNDVASSEVALNLAKSMNGSFGGASIKDGVGANAAATSNLSTKQLNSNGTLCGFLDDENVNYTTNIGDSIKSVSTGFIKYYFTCQNGSAVGYTVSTGLATLGTAPTYKFAYVLTQDYVVKGLNEANSQIDLSGPLKSFVDNKYKDSTNTYVHGNYVFYDAIINQADNYDVVGGYATFVVAGKNTYGTYGFSGKITFLGNHRVKVEFLSKTYYVNTQTGEVTAG